MTVDAHWHIIVPEIVRGAAGSEPWRPGVRREDGAQVVEFKGKSIRSAVREFVDVKRMLEEADALGIDHLLLSPWVSLLPDSLEPRQALDVCRLQNEALSAAAKAHPQRISALGCVPLQEPQTAARELDDVMNLSGICGVEIAASVGGCYLGDDRFLPFWEAAEALGAFVFIHPTTRGFDLPVFDDYYLWNTVANPMETTVTAAHMAMAGLLERLPHLKVLLAHGGGALPALRGRLAHAAAFQPQARARLHGTVQESLKLFYYDTLTHDAALLRALLDFVGADHLVIGSDYPFDMGSYDAVREVRKLGLSHDEEQAILGGNAVRLLGIREAAAR